MSVVAPRAAASKRALSQIARRSVNQTVNQHAASLHSASRSTRCTRLNKSFAQCNLSQASSINHALSQLVSQSMPSRRGFATTASQVPVERIRNLAIIAHVDHGKTTLVDCLLRQSVSKMVISGEARVMDSNVIEKERGITILSKCTTLLWENPADNMMYQLNIVDTPGHADFGGEVERIMSMVDGVCLVVDATDGPMTQTKFVLSKALAAGLRPVVVVNKVDRPTSRVGEVENEIWDLFVNLNANDQQMDFPVVYACARDGWATLDPKAPTDSMKDLFQTVVSHINSPQVDMEKPMSMLVTQIDSDQFLGKLLLGRVKTGKVKVGDKLKALDREGKLLEEVKIMKILCRRGLDQVVVDEAHAGDIISLAGFSKASVNSTLCHDSVTEPIFSTPIDPPTLAMSFYVNDSPLAGKAGGSLTSAMIRDRLMKEGESNVSIAVIESENRDAFEVRGRGELQLGVLIETMRREGYELSVSAPRVVYTKAENGSLLEPVEDVTIDVEQEYAGTIIEKMSMRKGELQDFVQSDDGKAKLKFRIPMRGLIGYRSELSHDTRGAAVMNNIFHGYTAHVGDIQKSSKGAIVSCFTGDISAFALESLEERGTLFVQPGMPTYAGQVIGENNREGDLECNPTKTKQLSNMRTVVKDDKTRLQPPRLMSLEEMIAYVRDDEVIEVTKKMIRLRKKVLDTEERRRIERQRVQKKKGLSVRETA